jgi:hypothetical protein
VESVPATFNRLFVPKYLRIYAPHWPGDLSGDDINFNRPEMNDDPKDPAVPFLERHLLPAAHVVAPQPQPLYANPPIPTA